VIRSFRDADAEQLFQGVVPKRLASLARVAQRKLMQLDAATGLQDLAVFPGNRLEALEGDRKGQHSIRVNDRLRVCFRWEQGGAFDVEIVDYH
jgi:proteic killer suppression protein